jgi:serine/threonine-protein kinase
VNDRLDKTIAEFERAWGAGAPPAIARYTEAAASELLAELVLVDMEFRWRLSAEGVRFDDSFGSQPRADDYARELPTIESAASLPAHVIAEEYRIRQLWGDRPNHDHFVSRFPNRAIELLKRLQAIDQELIADDPHRPHSSISRRRSPAEPDPRAPLPYSDFVLLQHVGSGGMGKVYRAKQISLDRLVAVKALLKSKQREDAAVERFLHEARILARLRHPGIVGVHGLGRFPGGGYFLVMDFIEGQDLAQRISAAATSIKETIRITIAIAQAVDYANNQGVVHCDLKPSNVLLDRTGNVFVTDFGFAELLRSDTSRSGLLPAGGTVAFMAPEQADVSNSITPATDVYGLGAVMYNLLTGDPPFVDDRADDIRASLLSSARSRDPRMSDAAIPVALGDACMKCLEKDSAKRFASAAAVAEALTKL